MTRQYIVDTVAPASDRRPTDEVRIRSRGRLPHWERDEATYFVTFRLFDSLPATVLLGARHRAAGPGIVSTPCDIHWCR